MAFVRDGASGGTSNNNNKITTTTTPTSPMNIGIPTQNKSVAKTTPTTPMNTGVTTPSSSKSSVGSSNNSTLKISTNTGKKPTSISDLKYLDTVASQDFTNYLNNLNNGGGDNGGNYGSGVGTITANTSYYDDLMKAFMEQNNAARQSMIDAIMSNLNAVKGTYKNQINSIVDQYQNLINENEVNRERTRRRIRENQANRGQLDSGLGRQERLDLDTTYDSQNSQLASARESAVNEIMNLIAQAEAEANTNKANVEQNYQNALLEWKLANQ